MTIETFHFTDRTSKSFFTKCNPLWWLMNDGDPSVPDEVNGLPYHETWPQWARSIAWWIRNPAANFMEYIIGVKDKNYSVTGIAPLYMGTLYDTSPPSFGWKYHVIYGAWSLPRIGFFLILLGLCFVSWVALVPLFFAAPLAVGVLPFVSLSRPTWLAYIGWRYDGGFGIKVNFHTGSGI